MIAQTLGEAETGILWYLAQTYSDRPAEWDKTFVEWPTDYVSVEVTEPAAQAA